MKKNNITKEELIFDEEFYSRTYPLISIEDRLLLGSKTVLFLGCSTNSPVATALLQQGLKKFILVDPDTIDVSNTNRIIGSGVEQVGKNKAEHLSSYLLNIHPFIDVTVYPQKLNDEKLEAVISQVDLILEMVDDPATKVTTRTFAKKHKKPVVMVTGIGDQPIVVVEQPNDKYFHRFTLEECAPFFNPQLTLTDRFRLYCTIIGVQNIPPAVMVNMILAACSKRIYIAQHGGTAMIAGGLGAFAAREILVGRSIQKEVPVNIPALLSSQEEIQKAEGILWQQLKKDYPDLFLSSDSSYYKALERIAKQVFQIDYKIKTSIY